MAETDRLEWEWVEPANNPGYSPTAGYWRMEVEQGGLWYSATVMPAQMTLPYRDPDGAVNENIHRPFQTNSHADLSAQQGDDNHAGVTLFSLPTGADPEYAQTELEKRLRAVLAALKAEEPADGN